MTKRTTLTAKRRLFIFLSAVVVVVSGALLLNWGYHRYFTAAYPTDHETLVLTASEEYSIPPSLIYAVIHTESGFREGAVSRAQAKGLMQLTDDTFQWALSRAGDKGKYTTEDLYDPQVNIHYGVYVLKLLGEQFEDTDTVLAAYNAGQGRVRDWLDDPAYSADGIHLDAIPYEETAKYVRRVRETQKRYQELYNIE